MHDPLRNIDRATLVAVTGGKRRAAAGGDGDSLARHDIRFPPLEEALKGKTKGAG